MSDSGETPRTRKPLGLKRSVDAGEVKQTFSHGRTNKVVVEVKFQGWTADGSLRAPVFLRLRDVAV